MKPNHQSFQGNSPVSLPFCPWKSKECSGYLGLWLIASLHRGQPAPREKERLQNQGCGRKSKKYIFSDNFRTKSNLKTSYPSSGVKKLRRKSEKCLAEPYIPTGANWNTIPGLLAQNLSLHEQSRRETTKALSGFW